MSRALIVIRNERDRQKAASWSMNAPMGTRIEFKEAKRSLPQNAKLWASLSDIAAQVSWHGLKLSPDDWKLIMLDALKREVRMVPNMDGNGMVNLGRSSSDLSKAEFADLLELVAMFGAKHGVKFSDENAQGEAA
ncbi:MAG TPA: recombination protein NinB [Azoarcus taiwanensis]|nr:recombination protein NinB [Azoarcus taiwanensis]